MMKKPALILIDVQQGFAEEAYFGGSRNNPDAEKRCADLLAAWRAHALPFFTCATVRCCRTRPCIPVTTVSALFPK